MKHTFPVGVSILGMLILTTFSGLASDNKKDPDEIGNRDVGKGVNVYSMEKEIAMGRQMAAEVERQAKILSDPVVSEYVNRVGQNLVRNSDARVPFTIKVIDTDEVNAFALPGGFFFVNSGLILTADTEAELAGVMAHEIAHVAARHATRQASRAQIARFGTIPLIFIGGWTGYGAYQGASLAVPMTFLKFSRAFESEADMLGLEYMYKAGYDPTALVDFFERIRTLEKRKPGAMASVFSTHPLTDDRISAAQRNIQQLLKAKPEYVVSAEFQDVKARLLALHGRRKIDDRGESRPIMRRATGSTKEPVDVDDSGSKRKGDEDERPTLKRRPGSLD